jgi:hypothetical protein
VGAFAAAFVFLIEQSGLFFTLGSPATENGAPTTQSGTPTTQNGAPTALSDRPTISAGVGARGSGDAGRAPGQVTHALVSFDIPQAARGFAFAILAIVSGFAADKVLGGMIGSVQKRLMDTAEKTKDTPYATASGG